jgi:hypothetical protein
MWRGVLLNLAVVSNAWVFRLMLELIDSICYKKPFPEQAVLRIYHWLKTRIVISVKIAVCN